MTQLGLAASDAETVDVDVVVVGVVQDGGHGRSGDGAGWAAGAEGIDEALDGGLADALTAVGATGAAGETVRLPTLGAITAPVILGVGLGTVPASGVFSHETLRRAAGAASRALAGSHAVASLLPWANGSSDPTDVAAVAEGHLLGSYAFTDFRVATLPKQKLPVETVTLLVDDAEGADHQATLRRAQILETAVTLTRDLVNTPAGDLPPIRLAQVAQAEAEAAGLAVEIWDERDLAEGGFGGLVGVGQASANPPRLVRLGYVAGEGLPTIALVGKGITFDSGGLSIKPAASMEEMKTDMAGAAAVLGATLAAARLELGVNVTCWLPLAENMVSGTSTRPGDVLRIYGGKTVEVLNTDAEGRLVLADALARAAEEEPDRIVDVATLTGAQIVALGNRISGVMANDDEWRFWVLEAADAAGESMWPMPLPEDLRPSLNSAIADIQNVSDSGGKMLTAGLFLQEFVPPTVPWAHVDIAGPSYNGGEPHGYTVKGATGAAVRTLVTLLEQIATFGLQLEAPGYSADGYAGDDDYGTDDEYATDELEPVARG
ncbi:MAG TPA: leucyl aminopeptidase [Frankiaceae bacterium]